MNFQDCHEEPVHIPGYIQSYGCLLGLNEDKTICFYSKNITTIFQIKEEMLGKKFEHFYDIFFPVIDSQTYYNISLRLENMSKSVDKIEIKGTEYYLSIYKHDHKIFIELEKSLPQKRPNNYFNKYVEELQSAKSADEIWRSLLKFVFYITGYDRVLIYKFQEDESGKVIMEEKLSHITSLLHLHYPEHDIPKQARTLYLKKKMRIFSNVYTSPVEIVSQVPEVDLTYSNVRALSPIHGLYIKNSGHSSSFSTSIIVDEKLWGLVSCQNTDPKHVDMADRMLAEMATTIAANAFFTLKSRIALEFENEISQKCKNLKSNILKNENLKESVFRNLEDIFKLSPSDGLAAIVDDEIEVFGETPSKETIAEIQNWMLHHQQDAQFFFTNSFYKDFKKDIPSLNKTSCGIYISVLGNSRNIILMWFRDEYIEHISWAGEPVKNIELFQFHHDQKRIVSPRTSFEVFNEEIKEKSKIWTEKDLRQIHKITDVILEAIQHQFDKLFELNAQLLRVNEELDSFSHTISHDLATPLTVIKLNLQLLLRTAENQKDKDKLNSVLSEVDGMSEMLSNVLNLSRIQDSELQFEKIETEGIIRKIAEDAQLTYHTDTEIVIGETPAVFGDKTLVFQVFQNIINNAVKYSSKAAHPKVKIWGEKKEDQTVYCISDNGIGIPEAEKDNVFKIFQRIDNAKSFSGSGVGLSIVQRIMNRLGGSVYFESKENEGTVFFLIFTESK